MSLVQTLLQSAKLLRKLENRGKPSPCQRLARFLLTAGRRLTPGVSAATDMSQSYDAHGLTRIRRWSTKASNDRSTVVTRHASSNRCAFQRHALKRCRRRSCARQEGGRESGSRARRPAIETASNRLFLGSRSRNTMRPHPKRVVVPVVRKILARVLLYSCVWWKDPPNDCPATDGRPVILPSV